MPAEEDPLEEARDPRRPIARMRSASRIIGIRTSQMIQRRDFFGSGVGVA